MTDPQGAPEDARPTCTRAEAARRLDVTERTIDNYIRLRRLAATEKLKFGRHRRLIYVDSVEQLETHLAGVPEAVA